MIAAARGPVPNRAILGTDSNNKEAQNWAAAILLKEFK
jgi:hypothetical protein